MLVDPALAPPVEVAVGVLPVWLTLLPFEVTEPDAEEDELDVDEDELDVDFNGLALADVDVDVLAVGVGVVFEAGVWVPQGLADAWAFLVPVALVFAVAEAVAGELLAALPVALAVPVALALALAVLVGVLVVVVLPVGLALLLAGLALVLLSAGLLAVAAGLAVGLGDFLASCKGDGEELDGHEVTVVLARLLGRLLGLAPPTDELIGLAPNPSVPGVPLVLRAVNPTAEPICPKACRSGGTARVTPMANTAQAAARADRSSTSRRSRGWRAWPRPEPCAGEPCAGEPPRMAFQRRTMSARKPPDAAALVAAECLLAYAGPDRTRVRIRSSPSGRGSIWSAAACRA